jgi:hypothetical protein
MPEIWRRKNHSRIRGPSAFIDSSMNGATTTATTPSGMSWRSKSLAKYVLTTSATAVAMKAPQAKQAASAQAGSGS